MGAQGACMSGMPAVPRKPREMPRPSKPDKGPTQRQLRVAEQIRHVLAEIVARGDIRDAALKGVSITVTEARVSPDMRAATVFCTPLGGRNAEAVIDALNRHKTFLRGELGHALTLRYTPALTFRADTSFDRAAEMDALFREAGLSHGESDDSDGA